MSLSTCLLKKKAIIFFKVKQNIVLSATRKTENTTIGTLEITQISLYKFNV